MNDVAKGRNIPSGVEVGIASRSELDTTQIQKLPRIAVSSLPEFSEVLSSTTDASFFLAWYTVEEQFKQRYPNNDMLHDKTSGSCLRRYRDLCALRGPGDDPLWTIGKAKREVAEATRQAKIGHAVSRSSRTSETLARALGQTMLSTDQDASQSKISLLDDSWMNDSSGVLGLATGNQNRKKKKKRKAKQAGKRRTTPSSRQEEESNLMSDAESVAAEVDDMALAEAKYGPTLNKQLAVNEPVLSPIEEVACQDVVDTLRANIVEQDTQASGVAAWVEAGPETDSPTAHTQPVLPLTPGLTPKPFANHRALPDTRESVGTAHGGLHSGRELLRDQEIPFGQTLDHSRLPSSATISPGLDPEDILEGGHLGQHPVTGTEVVILTKPRVAPPYARSLFVAG
jgi:hypothetical protein